MKNRYPEYLVLSAFLFLTNISRTILAEHYTSPNTDIVSLKESLFKEAIQKIFACQNPVTIYFQEQFENLLLKKGIEPHDLLKSLLDCNPKIPTTGKSGASFIITKDKRFILKSIVKDEFETFQEISTSYFEYFNKSPETLLVPFYGLYKVEGRCPHHLILMPNLVPQRTKATRLYDLKGRAKKANHRNPNLIDDNTLPEPPPFKITKLEQQQIIKDIEFLEKEGLLDYSLFLVEEAGVFQGIHLIDYLTRYNWKKWVAHFFKQRIWNEQQISTIPPARYALRMRSFIDRCLESKD